MIHRIIPSSGESLPALGLGTWQTFDVAPGQNREHLAQVLDLMTEGGSSLIDSSPMYGRAEEVVGELTRLRADRDRFFFATKVWTEGREEGIRQMETSFRRMGRGTMDLMQIHNLVDWKVHLKTLRSWKESGKIRYIGITHYTDDSHEALEAIIRREPLDFVQFNYAINDRHAEGRLLPLAAEKGVATLINRPLGYGSLMSKVAGASLPPWALEFGITGWPSFFLKFILSHPAVTCAIPATRNPEHFAQNLKGGTGPLPDPVLREKMAAFVRSL